MSGLSREATRKTFRQTAGATPGELRSRRTWTRPELAERASLSGELMAMYGTDPAGYLELEAWWQLTTAIGVVLGTFLRHIESPAGVRLLLGTGVRGRGPASPPAPPEDAGQPTAAQDADPLSACIATLRDTPTGGDRR